jgi:hypothetical protein
MGIHKPGGRVAARLLNDVDHGRDYRRSMWVEELVRAKCVA